MPSFGSFYNVQMLLVAFEDCRVCRIGLEIAGTVPRRIRTRLDMRRITSAGRVDGLDLFVSLLLISTSNLPGTLSIGLLLTLETRALTVYSCQIIAVDDSNRCTSILLVSMHQVARDRLLGPPSRNRIRKAKIRSTLVYFMK